MTPGRDSRPGGLVKTWQNKGGPTSSASIVQSSFLPTFGLSILQNWSHLYISVQFPTPLVSCSSRPMRESTWKEVGNRVDGDPVGSREKRPQSVEVVGRVARCYCLPSSGPSYPHPPLFVVFPTVRCLVAGPLYRLLVRG